MGQRIDVNTTISPLYFPSFLILFTNLSRYLYKNLKSPTTQIAVLVCSKSNFASLFLARTIGSGSVNGDIAIGDSRGSTTRATMNATLRSGGGLSHNVSRHFGCEFLDSPNTTDAVEYKLRIYVVQGTPACIGGGNSDNYNNFVSLPTIITAKEVAA